MHNLFISSFKMKEEKKVFVKKGVIFWGLVVVCFILIACCYRHMVLEEKIVYRQWESFQKARQHGLVHLSAAFFGDSHTANSIMPEYASDTVFNFGVSAENYIKIYYKARYILEHEKVDIDTVYLAFEPQSFTDLYVGEGYLFNNLFLYGDFRCLYLSRVSNSHPKVIIFVVKSK